MVLLENDQFLSRLTLMFDKARSSGHVDICMKRYDGRKQPEPSDNQPAKKKQKKATKPRTVEDIKNLDDGQDYMCLVRATLKKEKISSVIHSRDLNKFQVAYCNLLRSNMDGLKKQKKVKTKKKAAE